MSKNNEAAVTNDAVQQPNPEEAPVQENSTAYLMEYVPIKLFKDSRRYNKPLFVSVGDYSATIPRGSVQYVPRFIAQHIEECLEQDERTAKMIEALVEESETKYRQVG